MQLQLDQPTRIFPRATHEFLSGFFARLLFGEKPTAAERRTAERVAADSLEIAGRADGG